MVRSLADRTFQLRFVGVPGSYFKLCWGHAPTTGALEEYKVEIDSSGDLAGPDVGDILRCTLGIACSPQITGHRLAASNGMVVIGSAAACGAAEATVLGCKGSCQMPIECGQNLGKRG